VVQILVVRLVGRREMMNQSARRNIIAPAEGRSALKGLIIFLADFRDDTTSNGAAGKWLTFESAAELA